MVIFLNLKLILKGFIVGIGKIIPGVSGSMLAITLGIYEDIIKAITNFFSNIKANSKLLINFGLGVILAIILFSNLILFMLKNYYAEVMNLFLGLIIGTLMPFIKSIKFSSKNIFIFIIFFLLTLYLTTFSPNTPFIFKGTIINYLYTSFLGMIDAFTSIVPGISGTAIYMTLGSYEYVLSILGNPFSFPFIIYGIGLIIGIILVSYLINYLFKRWKDESYMCFFALMLGSISLLFLSLKDYFNIYLGIYLIIGSIIGYIFDK